MSRKPIGELLISKGLATAADIDAAVEVQTSVGGRIGMILVRLGAVSELDLLRTLSEQTGWAIQIRDEMPSPSAVQSFIEETRTQSGWWAAQEAVAWRARPSVDGEELADGTHRPVEDSIICAAVDPLSLTLRGVLEQVADRPIIWRLSPRNLIATAMDDLDRDGLGISGTLTSDAARLRELAEEAPVIDFVNAVFAESIQMRASDIHVEPFEDQFFVRMRVDGILQTVRAAPRSAFDAVCSRIKLLSGMDIGERRLPQDGRQAIRISGQDIDLRVSTLPAAWGESIVMRLLGKTSRIPQLTELGMPKADAEGLAKLVEQPNGIVLITGPTGSGKTTTIYRLLSGLNDGQRKIVTVEDPVEFDLPGVVQVHVRSDIGLTFAAGLRSILRQDPDVIMVGEIRDSETARIAVQAALTGHMVISTVHTNSAIAALPRLIDLGVENYLLADVLRGVVGQRLVRRLCKACSMPAKASDWRPFVPANLHQAVQDCGADFRHPVGCARCNQTGYSGRVGIYEILHFTPEIASAMREGASEMQIAKIAAATGYRSMFEDGVLKAARGETSLTEIQRVIAIPDSEMDDDPVRSDVPLSVE
ncbi:MAG: hypothetical protein RJA87_710 [Pseudomonadota bacterium]|jgi:general secretion pathway protein E